MTDMFVYRRDSRTSHVSKVELGDMTETEFGFLMDAEPFLKSGVKIAGMTEEMIAAMTEMVETGGQEMTP